MTHVWMLALLIATVTGRGETARCSMIAIPPTNSPTTVYFLGVPTEDTVAASAGSVNPGRGAGHFGRGDARPVHGQRFVIQRVGQLWRGLFKTPPTEGILIPWDFGPACEPVYWSRSARWSTLGSAGLVRATLREERHWVRGLPTFDVFAPQHTPYPDADQAKAERAWTGAGREPRVLTAEQLLGLVEVLPMESGGISTGEFDASAARQWEAAHPELAKRWPAEGLLRSIGYFEELARLRRIDPPIVGTYRVVVDFVGIDSSVVYMRTAPRAASRLHAWTRTELRNDGAAIGYYLRADGAPTPDAFANGPDVATDGFFAIALEPISETADSTVWRGDFDIMRAVLRLEGRPVVRDEAARLARRWDELRDPEWYFLPGYWIKYRDGRVRFEWEGRRGDRVVVTMRAERISLTSSRP